MKSDSNVELKDISQTTPEIIAEDNILKGTAEKNMEIAYERNGSQADIASRSSSKGSVQNAKSSHKSLQASSKKGSPSLLPLKDIEIVSLNHKTKVLNKSTENSIKSSIENEKDEASSQNILTVSKSVIHGSLEKIHGTRANPHATAANIARTLGISGPVINKGVLYDIYILQIYSFLFRGCSCHESFIS